MSHFEARDIIYVSIYFLQFICISTKSSKLFLALLTAFPSHIIIKEH